jgi:hypothetical protein
MSSEKKSTGVKAIIGGLIVSGGALFGFLNDGIDVFDKTRAKLFSTEATASTKEFSKSEIEKFMQDYNRASVNALNNNDPDKVKDYLDSNGDLYIKQMKDIRTNDKIHKKPTTIVENVELVSSNIYKVSTYEQYDIYAKDNLDTKETTDKHYHEYTLMVDKDNGLKVSKHTMPKSK